MKTNLVFEPIMHYIAHKITQPTATMTKQVAKSNPKIMTAAQALAIEAAALVKKI